MYRVRSTPKRRSVHGSLRGRLGGALAGTLVAVVTLGAVSGPVLAAEQPDAISSGTIQTPSGFTASIQNPHYVLPQLQSQEDTIQAVPRVVTNPNASGNWGFDAGQASLQVATEPQLPNSAVPAPFGDAGWHDWATYDLVFSQPIANPVIRVAQDTGGIAEIGFDAMVHASASVGVSSAVSPSGAQVPVRLSALSGSYANGYQIHNNTILPGDPLNETPWASSRCSSTEYAFATKPNSIDSLWLEGYQKAAKNPELRFVTNGCGDILVDTGGVPVKSLSIRHLLQLFSNWPPELISDGYAWILEEAQLQFSVLVPNVVSGSPDVIPASYGPATHVVSTGRLGNKLTPAFADELLTTATSGVAGDNSDNGYDAFTTAQLNTLFAAAGPGNQVKIPVPLALVQNDATLAGWVDFDRSGDFTDGERAEVTVPAGSTQAFLTWTVPSTYQPGASYLRLRLSNTADAVNAATGMADSGDVEDYQLLLPTPHAAFTVMKTADTTKAHPGDKVTYTLTVTNTGGLDYTDTEPASLTDDLSRVLDDATFNNDATEGATFSGSTLSWSGPLQVGKTVTITYTVTVNDPDTGDKTLTNVVVPDQNTGGGCEIATDCETTTTVTPPTVTPPTKPASPKPPVTPPTTPGKPETPTPTEKSQESTPSLAHTGSDAAGIGGITGLAFVTILLGGTILFRRYRTR